MIFNLSFLLCSLLSVITSAILIVYFFINKASRTFGFKLVFPILFFDLLFSLSFFLPMVYFFSSSDPYLNDNLCKVQAFFKLFSKNGTLFSALSISWTLYTLLVRQKPISKRNPIIYFSLFTFFIPLVFALIPFIFDNYDHTKPLSEVLCFIVVKHPLDGSKDIAGILIQVILYQLPIFVTSLLEIYFIFRIYYGFWQKKYERYSKDIKNLTLYPISLLLSWIWVTIERFHELVTDGETIGWLSTFAIQICILNGFFNSIIYGYLSINPFKKCLNNNKNDEEQHNSSQLTQSFESDLYQNDKQDYDEKDSKDNINDWSANS